MKITTEFNKKINLLKRSLFGGFGMCDRCLGVLGCAIAVLRFWEVRSLFGGFGMCDRCFEVLEVRSLLGGVWGAITKIDFIYKLPNNSNQTRRSDILIARQ